MKFLGIDPGWRNFAFAEIDWDPELPLLTIHLRTIDLFPKTSKKSKPWTCINVAYIKLHYLLLENFNDRRGPYTSVLVEQQFREDALKRQEGYLCGYFSCPAVSAVGWKNRFGVPYCGDHDKNKALSVQKANQLFEHLFDDHRVSLMIDRTGSRGLDSTIGTGPFELEDNHAVDAMFIAMCALVNHVNDPEHMIVKMVAQPKQKQTKKRKCITDILLLEESKRFTKQ
jgi:hypothetical protein